MSAHRLPQMNPRQLAAALRRAGFVATHQKGSHLYFEHPQTLRTTCVPMHPGDVHPGLLRKILFKDCGLTMREVQRLMK